MASYKTIQVTPREYALLMELKELLMERGTRHIEDRLNDGFSVEEIMRDLERDALVKGAVAGLAFAVAIHLMRSKQ